jgi:hypothetical protein
MPFPGGRGARGALRTFGLSRALAINSALFKEAILRVMRLRGLCLGEEGL